MKRKELRHLWWFQGEKNPFGCNVFLQINSLLQGSTRTVLKYFYKLWKPKGHSLRERHNMSNWAVFIWQAQRQQQWWFTYLCSAYYMLKNIQSPQTTPVSKNTIFILAVKLTRIAWFSAISPSILNRFSWNFAKAIFYSNPNSGKKFAKLYLIFQKLDHLTCNKILELV